MFCMKTPETNRPAVDYRTLGFTHTVRDAAIALDTTPDRVRDLMRLRALPYVTGPLLAEDGSVRDKLLVHGDDIADFIRRKRSGTPRPEATRERAINVLRQYLDENEPTGDYDLAVSLELPLLARGRNGSQMVHVHIPSLISWSKSLDAAHHLITSSAVEEALLGIGCIRKRGLIPVADEAGKQRWGVWWRVPNSMLPKDASDDEKDAEVVADRFGTLVEGDRMTHRDGDPYLTDDLGLRE